MSRPPQRHFTVYREVFCNIRPYGVKIGMFIYYVFLFMSNGVVLGIVWGVIESKWR